jgi:hypothetical protein
MQEVYYLAPGVLFWRRFALGEGSEATPGCEGKGSGFEGRRRSSEGEGNAERG